MPQITASQAQAKINAWDSIRRTISDAETILDPDHYFALDSEFDWEDFIVLDTIAHAYLGYDGTAPYSADNLKLILITLHADKKFGDGTEPDPYIYEAPYMEASGTPPTPVINNAKIQQWTTDLNPWLTAVNPLPPDPDGGTTRVFEVPLFDILGQVPTVNDSDKELHIYFGMRTQEEESDWAKRPDLMTYHPATDALFHFMSVDNFTSPRPPFVSGTENNYGLLN